jgi:hypothetical protein
MGDQQKKQKTPTTKILLANRKWEVPLTPQQLFGLIEDSVQEGLEWVAIPVKSGERIIVIHNKQIENIIIINPKIDEQSVSESEVPATLE